jgi:hypothetical protein
MAQKIHKKEFSEFMGIDMKADDINRPEVFAPQGSKSVLYGPRGEIKRFPCPREIYDTTLSVPTDQMRGLQLYKWKGKSYGTKSEKLLAISDADELIEIIKDTFTITYSGSGTAEFRVGSTTDKVQSITIWVDDSVVYSQTTTTTTVSALATAIGALTDFSATAGTNTDATLAGFERYDRQEITSSVDLIYNAYDVLVEASGTVTYFTDSATEADSDYVIGDSVDINGSLYFNDRRFYIYKFDGHYWYLAGLEAPSSFTLTQHAGGSLTTTGTYTIAARAVYTDYQGITHYGPFTFDTVLLTGANQEIRAQVAYTSVFPNVLYVTTTGSGTGTTIPTSSTAGKFVVGDIISIYTSSGVVTRDYRSCSQFDHS